jgi:hypothetical protein
MTPLAFAWVPHDDPTHDWRVGAGWAIEWLDKHCRMEGATSVVVTNTMNRLGVPELDEFEQRNARTSRRAGRAQAQEGEGPVLAYVPHAGELDFATRLAGASSLAVVETVSFPLGGWAARVGAFNLAIEELTGPLDATVVEAFERLKFYGNNGFGDDFGKRMTRSILEDLTDRPEWTAGLSLPPFSPRGSLTAA